MEGNFLRAHHTVAMRVPLSRSVSFHSQAQSSVIERVTFASVALSEHLGAYAVVGPKIVGAGGPDLGSHGFRGPDEGIRQRDASHCEDPDSSGDAVAAQHVRVGSRVGSRAQHAAQCLEVPALPHPDLD